VSVEKGLVESVKSVEVLDPDVVLDVSRMVKVVPDIVDIDMEGVETKDEATFEGGGVKVTALDIEVDEPEKMGNK